MLDNRTLSTNLNFALKLSSPDIHLFLKRGIFFNVSKVLSAGNLLRL